MGLSGGWQLYMKPTVGALFSPLLHHYQSKQQNDIMSSSYPYQPDRLGYLVKAVVMPHVGHRIATAVNMTICNAGILHVAH